MPPRILLIEDDQKLARLVVQFLEDQAFGVTWVADGDRGWQEFGRDAYDLVILDLMLPGRDGLTLCRQIRAASRCGVLMLTAKGSESDRVLGLELGADDYLTKPFGLPELLARIRAVLRRTLGTLEDAATEVRCAGPFAIDRTCRTVRRDGQNIELTRSEFDILDRLTRHPGRVFRRSELLEQVRGGTTEAYDRAVDSHVSNLRSKLEVDPRNPQFIQTVWGVGYRWAAS